jgi:hypothetical protein
MGTGQISMQGSVAMRGHDPRCLTCPSFLFLVSAAVHRRAGTYSKQLTMNFLQTLISITLAAATGELLHLLIRGA